ncbi:antibiotic biosynthesis monooxygenase [Undibacterium sp.]|jgi:heme-degrading monooxygenase HmoA|uniref:antibiotic biosynthesis monooxygenase family protein n=1 Tax=Undibacterium sp. TaxID=1914977 RepID=UPI002BA1F46D|nr:antibiotic biosynthesis monooxygenase [Undibacterium sp.]HTD05332.1 antibiotic biosynthesis monooxygenase [Undibacterium sp.]
MIAVIFEVKPHADKRETYLNIAASLKPVLEKMSGFISVERFQSISDPARMLSLSFWEDEESVKGWRNLELHRAAQARGRDGVFEDYRLRVAGVIRDYGMHERREQAPADSPFTVRPA